tara:strand:+ start:18192 stop:18683 length:492 start_codon:yes stop_codon:yes gene_type:complete
VSKLPPTGISGIGETGDRSQIASAAAAAPAKRRRRYNPKDEVIKNPGVAAKVNQTTPVGVSRTPVDVIEIPIGQRGPAPMASYTSADGENYSFKLFNDDGSLNDRRELLALFLSIRELTLGGDASVVMNAFGLNIKDANGKDVFPFSSADAGTRVEPDFSLSE